MASDSDRHRARAHAAADAWVTQAGFRDIDVADIRFGLGALVRDRRLA